MPNQDNSQGTYVQLPDNTYVQIPPNATPEQLGALKQKLAQKYSQGAAQSSGGGLKLPGGTPPLPSWMDKNDPAAQPGAFQMTKGGKVMNVNTPSEDRETGGEMVHRLLLTEANRLQGGVTRMEGEDLENAAKGQPNPSRPNLLPRMMGSFYRTAADMTTPKGAAITAGIALANTNPVTGIPVDAALAAHGGYGMYQHRKR